VSGRAVRLAEAINNVGIGGDDLGGKPGLERVAGAQGREGRDRRFIAVGELVGVINDGQRKGSAEVGEDLASDGWGEVGEVIGDLHGG